MATYLITGASRGVGLGLTSVLLHNYPYSTVIATARNVENEELNELKNQFPDRLYLRELDVASGTSVQAAADFVASNFPNGIDYIINNAALRGSTDDSDEKTYHEVYEVNVVGVSRMILAFLPLVLKSSKKSIMTISSNAGSYEYLDKVSQFIYGCGFKKTQIYPYRVSKAAVNFLISLFASDYKEEGVTFALLHPGFVDTNLAQNMTSSLKPMSPTESATGLLQVIHKLTIEDTGKFFNHKGEPLAF